MDDISDTQFLIGPNLLVAPVVEKGATSRKVYLPETSWYNFHTGIKYIPGTYIIENLPTDKVPLFVR